MKYIDPKSLTIGVLAASLVFACTDSNNKTTNSPSLVSEAKAATGVGDKWDMNQEWEFAHQNELAPLFHISKEIPKYADRLVIAKSGKWLQTKGGWEPFAWDSRKADFLFRRRIK